MIYRLLIVFAFVVLIEFYAFQAIKTITKNKILLTAYSIISITALVFIVVQFSKFDRTVGQTKMSLITLGLLLLVLIPKLILALILLGEDIFRIFSGATHKFLLKSNATTTFFAPRRKFVSQAAVGLAAIPFLSLLYGMTKGKYNFKVIKQQLFFPNLPNEFDGFTITQISDVHCGSFDNIEKITHAINIINEQNSDMILFTGDIVNALASEMDDWLSIFKQIKKHKYGNFAVLGNHDYGQYIDWKNNKKAEQENFENNKKLYDKIGFKLLMNENAKITKNQDVIAVVGVENWGKHFIQFGDINKAAHDLTAEDFKILMSHDPSHWEEIVKNHPKNFQLTLSGHTHGFQFGIEIPGVFKWSPAQYMYKQWAGLYENLGRYIYVNRGFGFHAYPGRVGIMPEITVIELKKSKNLG